MLVIVAAETGYDTKDFSIVYEMKFIYEILFSAISAVTGKFHTAKFRYFRVSVPKNTF